MKKLAVSTVKAYMKHNKPENTYTVFVPFLDDGFELQLRYELTIDERSHFIDRVVDACFDSAVNYKPEYFEPMVHATILNMCSNVPEIPKKKITDDDGNVFTPLDVEGMNKLYHLLSPIIFEPDNEDAAKFLHFQWDMENMCRTVIEDRRKIANNLWQYEFVNTCQTITSAARNVGTVLNMLTELSTNFDVDALAGLMTTLQMQNEEETPDEDEGIYVM